MKEEGVTQSRRRRWAKRGLKTLLLLGMLYFAISGLVVYQLTKTHRHALASYPEQDGLVVENIQFPSLMNDVVLDGWFFNNPQDQGRVIILVHGYNSSRDDPIAGIYQVAKELYAADYSIVMFDLRGYGNSQGERFSLGWYEQNDVRGAIQYIKTRGYTQIGVFGFSMGAASSLLAVAKEPEVDAIVTDSAYANLPDLLETLIPQQAGLPTLFNPGITLMAKILYDIEIAQVIPADAAAALAPRPLLVIHGLEDRLIDPDNAPTIWHARYGEDAQPDETLLLIPRAEHVQSYYTQPEMYIKTVTAFFDQQLN